MAIVQGIYWKLWGRNSEDSLHSQYCKFLMSSSASQHMDLFSGRIFLVHCFLCPHLRWALEKMSFLAAAQLLFLKSLGFKPTLKALLHEARAETPGKHSSFLPAANRRSQRETAVLEQGEGVSFFLSTSYSLQHHLSNDFSLWKLQFVPVAAVDLGLYFSNIQESISLCPSQRYQRLQAAPLLRGLGSSHGCQTSQRKHRPPEKFEFLINYE